VIHYHNIKIYTNKAIYRKLNLMTVPICPVEKWRLTTRLVFGLGVSIVAANDELPYVWVYASSIHNHKLSIYPLSKSDFLLIINQLSSF
jgi:hypothetical protein